jgi:hypothetical protein
MTGLPCCNGKIGNKFAKAKILLFLIFSRLILMWLVIIFFAFIQLEVC